RSTWSGAKTRKSVSSTSAGVPAWSPSRSVSMATIIKDKKLAADPWLRLDAGADGAAPAIPAEGDVIVPLAVWQAQREALLARAGRIGIRVNGHEEPSSFADDLR